MAGGQVNRIFPTMHGAPHRSAKNGSPTIQQGPSAPASTLALRTQTLRLQRVRLRSGQQQLPRTKGCLVCGRDNPHGLHLTSHVDPTTGQVHCTFTAQPHHIGFENVIHGGILATVLDEIMVWAAIWASRRACLAAELSLRFVRKAAIGQPLQAVATVTRNRSRLIETGAELRDGPDVICTATAKYVPLGQPETAAFLQTLVAEEASTWAAAELQR
jgi:uncharacterized protein (TIGR00369 family)